MKIGYPCINRTIGCTANHTFRLQSYSAQRLRQTVAANLDCLGRIVEYNISHRLLFLRISSDLVPFASHPVCTFDWRNHFRRDLRDLGLRIRKARMRISMHPDQFTLLNSPDRGICDRSVSELRYHAAVLDAMRMDATAKIQVHVGGVYGDKPASMRRFVQRHARLPAAIRRRLVIENDERLYSVKDCLAVSGQAGVPVLFDYFHHRCNPDGLSAGEALAACARTWGAADGAPMVDYSSAKKGARMGSHAESIDPRDFQRFLDVVGDRDCDVMLEIKDKERSALKAQLIIDERTRRSRP